MQHTETYHHLLTLKLTKVTHPRGSVPMEQAVKDTLSQELDKRGWGYSYMYSKAACTLPATVIPS